MASSDLSSVMKLAVKTHVDKIQFYLESIEIRHIIIVKERLDSPVRHTVAK